MNKFVRSGLVAAGVLAVSAGAQAAVDVTAVTGAGADIAIVGAAVFAVAVGVKLFKWIRSAL